MQDLRSFLNHLEREGVRYCHWKSTIKLDEVFSEAEDFDVLVHPDDLNRFLMILREHEFFRAESRLIEHPGVHHYYAWNATNQRWEHLHLFARLVTGDSIAKSLEIPIVDGMFRDCRSCGDLRVIHPTWELAIMLLRIIRKYDSALDRAKERSNAKGIAVEVARLMEDTSAAEVQAAWIDLDIRRTEADVQRLIDDVIACTGSPDMRNLGRQYRSWLSGLHRLTPFQRKRIEFTFLLRKIRFRARPQPTKRTRGAVLAIVGTDGSGKSTLVKNIAKRLSPIFQHTVIHTGRPPSTPFSFPARLAVRLARRGGPPQEPRRCSGDEQSSPRTASTMSLAWTLQYLILAYERSKMAKRILRQRRLGSIVISDRYPSEAFGVMDSPRIDPKGKGWFRSALAATERKFYAAFQKPDLLIRLVVDPEVAVQRNRDRGGAAVSHESDEDIRNRHRTFADLTYASECELRLDASRSRDDLVNESLRALAEVLAASAATAADD